jgi:uncharacterized protein YdhG (YjbR/CyaY superfamily)
MTVIDDFLAPADPAKREALERVRVIIKQVVPDAEEVISYGIPGFKYKGKYLFGFAPFKDHMSLFPASEPIAVMGDKLKDFKLSKGTIQFTVSHQVPEEIIKELVNIRLASIKNGQ